MSATLLLGACGLKGPLYLPGPAATAATPSTPNTPAR
ncbi:MAG: lipoprotein [Aquabacterium sp.]|nr:lipoprotein [Aquabacterium sp.]